MSPRRAVPTKAKKSSVPGWVYLVGGGVVVIAAALILYFLQTPPQPPPGTPVASVSAGSRTAGNLNSKVALVVFSDFQCPYCQQFATSGERQIEETYIKTNKINLTYKYLLVADHYGPGESAWSAEAAECANQQGKFWEYHDKLFAVWTGENVGTYTKDKLKQYATTIAGLDAAKFNQCLDTDQTAQIIQTDVAEAGRRGIRSTPSFLVNNTQIQVATFDISQFSKLIDPLLN